MLYHTLQNEGPEKVIISVDCGPEPAIVVLLYDSQTRNTREYFGRRRRLVDRVLAVSELWMFLKILRSF